MSGTTFKKRDLNRFRKTYRYIRKRPKNTFFFDKPTVMEAYYIDFTGSSTTATYNFTVAFPSAPYVTATAVDNLSNSQANVNVFINSVSTTQVQVEISSPNACRVHFHAIYIEC